MKLKLSICICAIFCFNSIICSAQTAEYPLPEVIPPSPNSAALGEYGNTPVSLTIGTPTISIPIWEIKGKALSLPISVSYRSSGIKIEDEGSNIGLGWTLNAGGVITRSIKGKPDMEVNKYSQKINPPRPQDLPYDMAPESFSYSNVLELTSMNIDPEPDLFYYNFGNYSGKFVLDESGIAQIMPDNQFHLEYTTNPQADIVITDLYGNRYYFDDKERVGTMNTSWYLSKIVSADGLEQISFEYVLEQISYWLPSRSVAYVDEALTNEENINPQNVQHNALRLSRINTNFGTSVDFISGINRVDYDLNTSNTPKSIKGIEVKSEGHCIKRVDFTQEFVETNKSFDNSHYLWEFYDMSWANRRMYLKNIKETSCSGNEHKTYDLEYWGRLANGKDSLPNKMSYAQDHWGYYNGHNNTSLRPAYSGIVPQRNATSPVMKTISGANRSPAFPWSRCGTLKSITYPTKGKSSFEYEANYASHETSAEIEVGGLRISKIIDTDVAGDILKTKKYEYDEGVLVDFPDYTSKNTFFVFPDYDDDLNNYYSDPPGANFICDPVAESHKERKLMIHSGSVNALGQTSGYHLNYRKVKEIEEGNGAILNIYNCALPDRVGDYSDTSFTNEPVPINNRLQKYSYRAAWDNQTPGGYGSWISTALGWPYAPKTDYSWKRGLLMEQHIFKEGSISPVARIKNEYSYKNLKPVYGLIWKKEKYCEDISAYEIFFYGNYKVQYGVAKLTRKTIIKDDITTINNYEYNTKDIINKVIETNSNNEVLMTKYTYPFDFPSSAIYREMTDKNMLDFKITEEKLIGNNKISQIRTDYKRWKDDLILPEKNLISRKEEEIYDDIIYHNYDDFGNLTEVSKAGGPHKTYLWGYGGRLPIAECLVNYGSPSLKISVDNYIYEKESYGTGGTAAPGSVLKSFTHEKSGTVSVAIETLNIDNYSNDASLSVAVDIIQGNNVVETLDFNFNHYASMGWIVPSGGKQLSVFLPAGEYSLRFNANNSSFIHNGSGNMGLPNFTFDGRIGFNHLVTGVYSGKFFHTSFEEDVNSNSTHAYTGKYSHYGTYQINLESPAPGDYILEYWIYNTGLQSWEHKEEPVSLTSSGSFSKTIGQSNRYIDEIRFYPVHAQITTYTYEPLVGMTSMTDVSGRKTTYDYDDFNRLEFIRDDKEMLLQENKYHYKN